MPYLFSCPSCQARLLLKDETGEQFLVCPRCLSRVPHPSTAAQAPVTGTTSVTAVPQRTRAVPSVESETKRSTWTGYFIVLAFTVVATIGLILALTSRVTSPTGAEIVETLLWLLFALVLVLTGLILYPIGKQLSRSGKHGKVAIVVLLVFLTPVAFFVAFATVCSATFAVLVTK